MKIKTSYIVALCTLLIPLSYNACREGFQGKSSSSVAGQCFPRRIASKLVQPQAKRELFAESKLKIKKDNSGGLQAIKGDDNRELVALMNNSCLREDANSEAKSRGVSNQILGSRQPGQSNGDQAYLYKLPANINLQIFEEAVNTDPCIVGISYNQIYKPSSVSDVVNDTLAGNQRHLGYLNLEQSYPYIYDTTTGLQNLVSQNNEVTVAIIDTGVSYDHPDIDNQMWTDQNGFHGVNSALLKPLQDMDQCLCQLNNAGDACIAAGPALTDPVENLVGVAHGTHVAGIVASEMNNEIGLSGVAGAGVDIMAVRVFNPIFEMDCSIDTSLEPSTDTLDVAAGIRWAADNGADVINLSLQLDHDRTMFQYNDVVLESAVQYALEQGVIVVTAAGNASQFNPAQAINESTFSVYPAIYGKNYGGVITVGSIDVTLGDRSFFSHYGLEYVEIGAPGSENENIVPEIRSAGLGGILSLAPYRSVNDPPQYQRMWGTSMAAPMVAGAAAIVKGMIRHNTGTEASPAEVERILSEGAAVEARLTDDFKGGRSLNLLGAIKRTYIDYDIATNLDLNICP